MNDITCPVCGGLEHYRLGDNRLQCALCRKKFTAESRRSRLPLQMLNSVAESFWRMIPASAAATERGLNCKTVQKYYDFLRRAIADINERYAVEQFGAAGIHPESFHEAAQRAGLGNEGRPLFCLVRGAGGISLLRAREEESALVAASDMAGWVYARDLRALAALDLDRMHCLPVAGASDEERAFWPFAKRGLVRYHGGFKKNFPYFVREMEFRFNHQREDSVLPLLRQILQDHGNTDDRR